MPVLEITPDMIGPDRTRLALNYVESVMLWPHDPEQRAEAMKTGTAAFVRSAIDAVPAAKRAAEAAKWLDWFGLLADAYPLRHIRDQAKAPFMQGTLAGELLAAAVVDYSRDGRVKLDALKTEMTAPKRRKSNPRLDISRSTLENTIWARYKPVSHLWAAYTYTAIHRGDATFPCTLDSLPDFLAFAEFFGLAGARITTPRRNEALLTVDRLWTLPLDLDLKCGYQIDWKGRPPLF